MKKHTKIYLKYFDYALDDIILCTVCNRQAVDIHHIERRGIGGSKERDYIENLAALCRECHEKAERNKEFNQVVKEHHIKLLK